MHIVSSVVSNYRILFGFCGIKCLASKRTRHRHGCARSAPNWNWLGCCARGRPENPDDIVCSDLLSRKFRCRVSFHAGLVARTSWRDIDGSNGASESCGRRDIDGHSTSKFDLRRSKIWLTGWWRRILQKNSSRNHVKTTITSTVKKGNHEIFGKR